MHVGHIIARNNIKIDVKVKYREEWKTQAKLVEEIDTTKAYVNSVIKQKSALSIYICEDDGGSWLLYWAALSEELYWKILFWGDKWT